MEQFNELNDLVLHLKGLVLVRNLRKKRGADMDEIAMFNTEIGNARTRLAQFAQGDSLAHAA